MNSKEWKKLPVSVRPVTPNLLHQLFQSRAQSTSQRYLKEIGKFISWCKLVEVQPAPPLSVALAVAYMSKVYNQSKSYSSLVLTHGALKWYHSFLPFFHQNPFDSKILSTFLESAKRVKPTVNRKVPVSTDMIKAIVDKYATPTANLKDLRLACLCTLGFAAFLRFDELSNIVPLHMTIRSDYLKIFIPRAKNDVYREGNFVYVSRIQDKYCPVAILERYMTNAGMDSDSNLPLFRGVRFYKSSNTYKLCRTKLSYSRCREIFKNCLKDLGHDSSQFGLHSLRSGGATAAVRHNSDLSERSLKIHGRWRTSKAKDMYILDDVTERLKISSNLGL